VNFVEIKNWILMLLATTGKKGRAIFTRELIALLEEPNTPQIIKVVWNKQLGQIFAP